jgi:hypothetical protein
VIVIVAGSGIMLPLVGTIDTGYVTDFPAVTVWVPLLDVTL